MSDYTGIDFVGTTRSDTYPAIDPAKADLAGKVVLVSGASRGIGRAIAIAFAQAGAAGIVLLARGDTTTTEAAVRAAARVGEAIQVLTVKADVTSAQETANALAQVKTTLGRLDFVINNAGYVESPGKLGDADAEDWWKVWEINLRGTYNVTRAALPLLLESDGSKTVVNVGTVAAHWTYPMVSAYQLSKFALIRFTEQTVAEYGDQGVISIVIHPCATLTDLNKDAPPEILALLKDTPELPAHTIVWLVKERREWLSGRYFSCNWDVEEVAKKKDEIVAGNLLRVRMAV